MSDAGTKKTERTTASKPQKTSRRSKAGSGKRDSNGANGPDKESGTLQDDAPNKKASKKDVSKRDVPKKDASKNDARKKDALREGAPKDGAGSKKPGRRASTVGNAGIDEKGAHNGTDANEIPLLKRPAFTLYSGVALSLAWFYCIWFVPQVYLSSDLLSWQITVAWLFMLGSSALTLFIVPALLGTERHLSDSKPLLVAAPVLMSASGLVYTLGIASVNVLFSFLLPVVMGVAGALFWIQWGEYYATIRASYHVGQVALTVGVIILVSMLAAVFVPQPVNTVLVSALPLLSLWLLLSVRSRAAAQGKSDYPRLLPNKERSKGLHNALIVGGISAVASASCYFTVAIIPLDDLSYGDYTFTVGALWGVFALVAIGVVGRLRPGKASIFRVFPWLLVLTALAVILYLPGDVAIYNFSYRLALLLSTVFEVLLLMYIGILSSKGYISPALSFGFSGGFVRGGILVGNGIAVVFEHFPGIQDALLLPVTLLFAFLPVALIIPLVRREYAITAMTAPIERTSDLEDQVQSVSDEFGLSAREREVLLYLARGYTAEGIGKQLFISNFTAQTHIQHIYTKTGIHKRSDLIDYITKRATTPSATDEVSAIDKLPDYWPLPS